MKGLKEKITFILLLFSTLTNGQNKEINFERIYNFINTTITIDTTKFNLSNNMNFRLFDNDSISIYNDTIFTQEDKVYFNLQLASMDKFKWGKDKIIGAKLIEENEIIKYFKNRKRGWVRFRRKFGNCLTRFSIPIFTIKGDYCIFYSWTQCDYEMGNGGAALYEIKDGKWRFVKRYSFGIS